MVRFQYTADGLKTADGSTLRAFSLDGKNDIQASIVDSKVYIPADKKPDYIYYGWKPYSDGNLVNSENLPASTFKIKVK